MPLDRTPLDRVMLAGHVLVTGAVQGLHQFLLPRCATLVFVHHPLQPFTKVGDHHSRCLRYRQGRLVDEVSHRQWPLPPGLLSELCYFAWHAWLTLWWGLTRGRGCTLFIGANNLSAFVGLLLKRLRCVHCVVYYAIDYIPQRFRHRWANALYLWVDRLCVQFCDQVWNISPLMVEGREARGVPPTLRARQITVPQGTDLTVVPLPLDAVERSTIVYFGGLMEKQGVHLAVQALAQVRRRVPQARLLVIGGGYPDRLAALQGLSEAMGVRDAVEFTGLIEDHSEAVDRIRRCAVGVAPYPDTPDNYTRYADPGKAKVYLAAGLPVVITAVPAVASLIERHGAGMIVRDDADALAEALIRFLTDDQLLTECKRRARELAEQYEWDAIFTKALEQVPRDVAN